MKYKLLLIKNPGSIYGAETILELKFDEEIKLKELIDILKAVKKDN